MITHYSPIGTGRGWAASYLADLQAVSDSMFLPTLKRLLFPRPIYSIQHTLVSPLASTPQELDSVLCEFPSALQQRRTSINISLIEAMVTRYSKPRNS